MDLADITQELRHRLGPDVVGLVNDRMSDELDSFATELTTLYQTEIPAYERYDTAVIQQNTRTILAILLRQLSDSNAPLTTEGIAELALSLAEQGIPLGPVSQSLQLGARRFASALRKHAVEVGLTETDLAAIHDAAWEWAIEGAAAIQLVQQDFAASRANARGDFLRHLVTGTMAPADLARLADTHQLDVSHSYRVAYARPPEGGTFSEVVTAIRIHGATASLPVVDAVIDGFFVALLPRLPEQLRHPATVGIGHAAAPSALSASYGEARRAFTLAERYGRPGMVELSDLGPLPLLDQEMNAAATLDAKHIEPLRRTGASGIDVMTTVVCYLEHDRRVDETACLQHLHRNTVRQRLTKFATVTGLDLERTDDFVLAWWLLRREHAPRPAGAESV